jgi:HAD superfamily hydrolase (TIGR01549 family)
MRLSDFSTECVETTPPQREDIAVPSSSAGRKDSDTTVTHFVLFDLDNTLIDRQAAYERWARSFAASRGLHAEAVRVLRYADEDGFATREAVFETARRSLGLSESVEALITDYRREYPTYFEPDPAVIRTLERLRAKGFRVGVVTNGPASQREKLDRAGLRTLIDGICISEEYGVEKPDARIFAEVIRRCCGHRDPNGIGWMVGDSAESDVAGGCNSGLRTIWISRGRTWKESGLSPDLIASDVVDAVGLILSAQVDL